MHKYLRAIGFSHYRKRKDIDELLKRVEDVPMKRQELYLENDENQGQICTEFAKGLGLAVFGSFDEWGEFKRDYYFPYYISEVTSSKAPCQVQKHVEKEEYSCLCEELRLGISLIFYMQNGLDYAIRAQRANGSHLVKSVRLTGLSVSGKILLPVMKTEEQKEKIKLSAATHSELIEAARQGDEGAMATLSLEELDLCAGISRRIQEEDVYSVIDTSFMPFGVECDQYSIIGTITSMQEISNSWTEERLYKMTIECNDVMFQILINKKDLQGVPAVGRRFKGEIWMQGVADFMKD